MCAGVVCLPACPPLLLHPKRSVSFPHQRRRTASRLYEVISFLLLRRNQQATSAAQPGCCLQKRADGFTLAYG